MSRPRASLVVIGQVVVAAEADRLLTAEAVGIADGRVVSGGDDRRVRVWDVSTRAEVAQLGCSVTSLATGPFGSLASP